MKFMRRESWRGAWARARRGASMHAVRCRTPLFRRPLMQWQTPTATDLRFGFEITLYAAAR